MVTETINTTQLLMIVYPNECCQRRVRDRWRQYQLMMSIIERDAIDPQKLRYCLSGCDLKVLSTYFQQNSSYQLAPRPIRRTCPDNYAYQQHQRYGNLMATVTVNRKGDPNYLQNLLSDTSINYLIVASTTG